MIAAARPRGALGAALAGMLLVLALMAVLQGDFNPDWTSYALIYEEGGAYLAEQRRDPLFLALISTLRRLFGPDGYVAFRYLVAAYFAAFTFVLLRGRVLRLDARSMPRWPLLLLGLLPFVAPRFTIQIREGLALTLVLAGMAWLCTPREQTAGRHHGVALALFVAGCLVHSGATVLLLALLAGMLIRSVCRGSIHLELWILLALGLAAAAAGAGIAIFGLSTRAAQQVVQELYEAQADAEAALTAAKWLYWGAYGLGVAALAARVRGLYRADRLPPDLRPVLGLIALVILPATYLSALLLLAGGLPLIVVAGAARIMNMLLSMTLLVLALRGVLTVKLGVFALLVLVDQARVIVEALLSLAPAEP